MHGETAQLPGMANGREPTGLCHVYVWYTVCALIHDPWVGYAVTLSKTDRVCSQGRCVCVVKEPCCARRQDVYFKTTAQVRTYNERFN